METLMKERERYLAKMKEVVEDIREMNKQYEQLNEELETIKYDVAKEVIQRKIDEILWKINEYIMIWDDLNFRVEMLEKEIKKQGGEVV